MLTCVIVDDESQSRDALSGALEVFCPDVTILAEADSVAAGIRAIREHNPDIAFLDIEMADGTGFDIIESLHNVRSRFVMVTAYDNHALKAYEMDVIQYLLKPVDRRKLTKLVDKLVDEQRTHNDGSDKTKIPIDTIDGTLFLSLDDIEYAVVKDNWLLVKVVEGREVFTNMSLSSFEELVDRASYIRIHRSYIINTERIESVNKSDFKVKMVGGDIVPISRNNKERLLNYLNL